MVVPNEPFAECCVCSNTISNPSITCDSCHRVYHTSCVELDNNVFICKICIGEQRGGKLAILDSREYKNILRTIGNSIPIYYQNYIAAISNSNTFHWPKSKLDLCFPASPSFVYNSPPIEEDCETSSKKARFNIESHCRKRKRDIEQDEHFELMKHIVRNCSRGITIATEQAAAKHACKFLDSLLISMKIIWEHSYYKKHRPGDEDLVLSAAITAQLLPQKLIDNIEAVDNHSS